MAWMIPTIHENALIALAAAASWGGGDFSGGMGVKTAGGRVPGAIRFVVLAHGISLVALVGMLSAQHAGWPHGMAVLWAMAGGVLGALGIVAFYIALSRGGMGVSAAVSGLLAAAIPAVVSSVMEGAPGGLRLAGFALAGGAIWLIAAGDSPESAFPEEQAAKGSGESRSTMVLAIFAGVAFGMYFVALKMASPLGLAMPMAIARASSVTLCSVVLGVMGGWGWAPKRGARIESWVRRIAVDGGVGMGLRGGGAGYGGKCAVYGGGAAGAAGCGVGAGEPLSGGNDSAGGVVAEGAADAAAGGGDGGCAGGGGDDYAVRAKRQG